MTVRFSNFNSDMMKRNWQYSTQIKSLKSTYYREKPIVTLTVKIFVEKAPESVITACGN